ncbi:MAG: aminopeptidase P N-terminal domain-containing protein [Planctomycetes bacterium]|nr:aminopeptidase P N-terminal domain-containing protein [Planctomycetota bacterium]
MSEPYRSRREKLMKEMGDRSIAILCTAPVRNRNNDVDFKFRPDSNFYYLTGFDEPEAVAVLIPDHPETPYTLFVLPRDKEKETWTGRRAGVEGARKEFGADAAHTVDELDALLPKLIENRERLYYRTGKNESFDARVLAWIERIRTQIRTGVGAPSDIADPAAFVHEHRLFKGAEEVAMLKKAGDITLEAHLEAMRAARPGVFEFQVEAGIDYTFRRRGGNGAGYLSIVASGPNATTLHYTTNNRKLEDGDLMLIDAGCEFGYYTADVTRTFPVSGHYSNPQREIYEAVLDAQQAGIEKVKQGVRFQDVHDASTRVLLQHLIKLGILNGTVEESLKDNRYKRYFMHRTSHWLGMDVHDCGNYYVSGASRAMEPGMVLTVEPGLYFDIEDTTVDARYRGIGVRIEDDVLVTENGCDVLTKDIPKLPAAVEKAVAGA